VSSNCNCHENEQSWSDKTAAPSALETEWIVFNRSPIHGIGGFARVALPKGTRLLEYVGEKISKQESLRRCESGNEFVFSINEHVDLDGCVDWNPARWLNHSCAPSCEAVPEGEHIWLVAIRDIPAGEEITFNYGYDLVDYKEHPCGCGAPNCVGYIVAEEFFKNVSRQS
jgi:SET domain-containing protein